jgi:hypothetical protein
MPHRRPLHPSEVPLSRADRLILSEIAALFEDDNGALAEAIAFAWIRRACKRCDNVKRAYHVLWLASTADRLTRERRDDDLGGVNDNG